MSSWFTSNSYLGGDIKSYTDLLVFHIMHYKIRIINVLI